MDKNGNLIRLIQRADEEIKASSEVVKAAQISESCMTRQSIEFINGKRKIRLRDISKKHKKKLFLRALFGTKGIVKYACQAIGVSRTWYEHAMKTDPDFRYAVELIQEDTLDWAEGKLLENIERGYEASTIFYLKTKGAKRGYSEKDLKVDVNEDIKTLTDAELLDRIKQLSGAISAASGTKKEAT